MSRNKIEKSEKNISVGDFLAYIEKLKKESTSDDNKYLGNIDDLPILAFTENNSLATCFTYENELGIVIHAQDDG